jgi:hypothetical protein
MSSVYTYYTKQLLESEKRNILLSKNKKKEHFTQIKICILWLQKLKAQNVVHDKKYRSKKEHSTQKKEHSTQKKEHFTQQKEHFTQIGKRAKPYK